MIGSNLINVGRILIGISVAGIGLLHFFFLGVQPILAPISSENTPESVAYLVGLVLTLAGLALILNIANRLISLALAGCFVLFFIFGHLPNRMMHHPEILAFWTDAIKLLAMAGGAMILASCFGSQKTRLAQAASKSASIGKYLFALMLVAFGVDHFLYVEHVHKMVPQWIPIPVFWTYLSGLALIAAGLAIIINIYVRLAQTLLALMLLTWLLILHLPTIFIFPITNTGSLIGSLTCAYFAAIAILLNGVSKTASLINPEQDMSQ